jgi:hypothetical protein
MQRTHFRDPHGERPRTPKSLPRHTTAAVLCHTQAAVSGSVFSACVGGARRSVLLRAARPAETTRANNATEGVAAGTGPDGRWQYQSDGDGGPRCSDVITRCGLPTYRRRCRKPGSISFASNQITRALVTSPASGY